MPGVWKSLAALVLKLKITEGGSTLIFWNYFQTLAWAFAKKRLISASQQGFQDNRGDSSSNIT